MNWIAFGYLQFADHYQNTLHLTTLQGESYQPFSVSTLFPFKIKLQR